MPEALHTFDGWLLTTTLAGGVVLLIGTLWMAFTRQPVQRQRIGEFALLAALLVALPAALPKWWSLPGTKQDSTTSKTIFGSALPSNRFPPTNMDQGTLIANDRTEHDEEEETRELLNAIYTMRFEEKEETDAAAIASPVDNVSDHNCTKGDASSSLLSVWGRWILRLIGLAYLGLVTVLLIRCSIGYYGLWRFWRQRRPAPAHVHAALAELEPDSAHRPRIGVNSLVHGPVSYGLWKPTILLPPAFCNEGDPEKLRWILAHELTHLRRRDAWGCLLLALGGALYFHVPWFWWMKRHVRLAQEYVADASAAQIANAVEYAQYLLSLTTLTSRPTLASSRAAGVFETPSDLYRRVHMLLHQRNVIERGAPRWWTLTAAASFLTLAACTAGVQLFADERPQVHVDEPAQLQDVILKIVASDDDDDKGTDKKKTESKTIRINGKTVVGGDGKTFVFTTDDDKGKPGVVHWAGAISPEKQKAIEEALKKIDKLLDKTSRQIDDSTRAQLEEVKKSLKALNETNKVVWQGYVDAAKEGQNVARLRLMEAAKGNEEMAKVAQARVDKARKQASVYREKAQAAEKDARVAQERALLRWREAKDGDDKDQAIKELEKAIAEKERALRLLKSADVARATNPVRSFDVAPLVTARNIAPASSKGRLGVVMDDINSNLRGHLDLADGQGLMISEVIDPSPAWNNGNGLRSSDVLVELAGKKVPANQDQFREMVNKLGEGTYSAVVFRKGKKMTIGGIKLPGAEKNKKVVLEDGKFEVNGENMVKLLPLVNKANQELVVGQLSKDAVNSINLANKANALVLGEVALADNLNALKEHHLALELANAKLGKGDLVIANPIQGNIKVEQLAPLKIDGQGLVNIVQAQPLANFVGQPLHVTTHVVGQDGQGSSKPRLGVTLEEVPDAVSSQIELPEGRGLFVREVIDGSAAQKAGILKNDILIEFADKPVSKDHDAFTRFVKGLKPGKYTATVVRKGKEIRVRGINLEDAKAASEDKKAKVKEWLVEGDKNREEENEKPKAKVKESKKEKDDFFPNAGGNRFNFAPAQGNMSVSINNDQFTAKKTDGDRTITMTGTMVNGKAEPKNITIKNDEGEKKYKAVKDVPEEDRADVEKMLTSFKGNVFRWNGNNNNAFFNNGQFDKQLENQLKVFERSMKQLGEGNPGFDQMERELERLREQLKKIRGIREGEDK